MGASVMPVPTGQPSPQEIARVQANVAKMRAASAPEEDVLAYLQHEDSLSHAMPSAPAASSTDLSMRNIGRSLTQGATFGFGDELGLVNRDADHAFKAAHPVANFFARLAGGMAAPVIATAAAPELLAGAGGAALLGGASGALTGAGEADGSLSDRAKGAAFGGLLGAAGGAATYGVARGLSAGKAALLDRMHPERAVARSAASLLDPGITARLAQADAIAPGGASIATAAVPPDGLETSRMLRMLSGVANSPKAGAQAEAQIMGQKAALETARKQLGSQMDQIQGAIPIDPRTRAVMAQVTEILGSKAPVFGKNAQAIDIQEARDGLSRLRFAQRNALKRGTEANGPNLHDISQAKAALQQLIYDAEPKFAALDRPYAVVMDHLGHADDALETVQRSRASHAANTAYGSTAGSLGGSLPRGAHGVTMTLLEKILTDKAGAADAVARMIAKPGGPQLVDQILKTVPQDQGVSRWVAPTASAAIPAMRGLLFPQQP